MAAHPVLEPLSAAGLIARVRTDGRLTVYPEQAITRAVDAYVRTHRDELVAALTAPNPPAQPLGWPPPTPAWFVEWMRADDARRAETMAAGKRRLADARKRSR